jgi:hypothetical protein
MIAASLALAAGGAAPVFSQLYRMVSVRGSFVGDADLRVWEVTADGVMTQIQQIDFVGSGELFQVDPLGRFLVYPRAGESEPIVEVYSIDSQGLLTLASTTSREGWSFSGRVHTITPDGIFYITQSVNHIENPDGGYLEVMRIKSDMTLEELPGRLKFTPTGLPEIDGPLGRLGALTVDDGYLLLVNDHSDASVVLPMSLTGELSSPTQVFDYGSVQPITGGWAIRPDQKIAVTGPMGEDRLTSYAVSPDGFLTPIDTYDFNELGPLSVVGLSYHPGGDSLVTGGRIARAQITPEGWMDESAQVGPLGSIITAPPAVSPDGKIAVATWENDSEGIHWGVYSLDPAGGITLIRDHPLPIGYRDLKFIPPRTEDMLGDANGDGRRDIRDVVKLVNHLNGSQAITGPVPLARTDATQDGTIDEDDLVWIVDFLLGLNP